MTERDPTRELLADDRAARALAQREFTLPVILEAGAGTGKTTTLVARVLAWALAEGWDRALEEIREPNADPETEPEPDRIAAAVLEGIVSITFTEAAAAEMESRIAAALSRVAAGEASEIVGFDPPEVVGGDPVLAVRAHSLLSALDHVTVRTIHAYCLYLLKRYPLEAQVHPDLVVDADGQILEQLVSEIVEGGLRHAYTSTEQGPLVHLARTGIGPRRIADALRALAEIGVRSEDLREDPFRAECISGLFDRLRAPLESFETLVAGRFDSLPRNQNAPKVAAAAVATLGALDRTGEPGLESLIELCSALRALWNKKLVNEHLRKWKRDQLTKGEAGALGDGAEDLPAIAGELRAILRQLMALDPRLVDQARRALSGLLATIEQEMRARGVITFNGLLSGARDLLTKDAGVRRRERAGLRQLLVDEFQDTDRLQCDLVRLLALGGSANRRPGLFVVGDPKQSIYGWRNADLEAYESFVSAAEKAGGRRYSLVENFRSAAPILAEVDRAITPVMRRRRGLQPTYERLLPCAAKAEAPGFDRAGRAAVEYWVSWAPPGGGEPAEEKTPADLAAQLEAEAVARDIVDLQRLGESGWSDFAVLLRSGYQLDNFLSAFRDAGVPFAVSRDKSYFRRREIIEASALIRAVVNPVDHLALLTFLRSPVVGVPDAAIIPLWGHELLDLMSEHDRPSKELSKRLRKIATAVASELPTDIPGIDEIKGWEKSFLHGIESLLHLRASFADDPADRFLEHIRSWLLLEATESARYLGSFRVANLERFLRHLELALDRSGGDVQSVLRALRRGVAEAREAEEAVPKEAALDAVQILTIHAAKGLEFKHVYLVQLHAGSGDREVPQIEADERRAPGEPLEYRLFGSPTPNFDQVLEHREAVEHAERVRLLYVAMTRARERLVLIGRWPLQTHPVPVNRCKTFLDLLQSRAPLPATMRELLDLPDGPGGIASDARWRFPAYEVVAATDKPTSKLPGWLPAPGVVRASVDRLRSLGDAAQLYMERPFQEAATAEAARHLDSQARESTVRTGASAGSRDLAMQVGTAIHRLFEDWDLDAEPEVELRRRRTRVLARLRSELHADSWPEGKRRAEELLDRIERGTLLQRFLDLRPRVVARELAVLLPPKAEAGPVGFGSGSIDLLYRDAANELVIVDFKTDTLDREIEIETRAVSYTSQEAAYAEAMRSALKLDRAPAGELWFLWPDHLHLIPAGAA